MQNLKQLYCFMSAICWDQWFPEAARAMVLQGAEILLYPTAIGSEPQDQGLDSRDHWKRVMQGHAGANVVSCCTGSLVIIFYPGLVLLVVTWYFCPDLLMVAFSKDFYIRCCTVRFI